MGILKRMSAFKPKFITHKIPTADGDQEFKFYPVPTLMLVSRELRESVGPLVEVLQSMMAGPAANVNERHTEQTPDGGIYEVIKASSVQTIDFMENLRRKSTNKALDTLFNDETRYTLGRLIGASLRDDFPPRSDTEEFEAAVRAFMDHENLDIAMLLSYIVGFLKANAKVIGLDPGGDLGKLVKEKVKQAVDERLARPVETQVPTDDDQESTEKPPESEAAGAL